MTTDISHRANVTADVASAPCSPAILPEEVIVGGDGQYLGNFVGEYSASPKFNVSYPIGWTNGNWFEQPAAKDDLTAVCDCVDCHGIHSGRYVSQRQPNFAVTPDDATIFDFWDHAVNPQHYTGTEGCNNKFDTAYNCFGGSPPTFYHGLCQPDTNSQPYLYNAACWPLVPFAVANPSSRIRVVTDTSGPVSDPCVQEEPALEIDFSGNGLEGTTFVGEGGGYDTTRCGFDSSPPNGWTGGERSATGWTVARDSCWRTRFWIKAVADNGGFVCSGYDFRTRSGFWPFVYVQEQIAGNLAITLTSSWQLYDFTWKATFPAPPNPSFPEPVTNTPLALMTLTAPPQLPYFRPIYPRAGRVHIKHVSVVPCFLSEGVHIQRFEGDFT